MTAVSIVILSYNEALHIARAIASVRPFASEIFVVDSFSKDDTVAIARAEGATVIEHPFVNHAKQFQWALDNVPITGDWIMRLDADEIIEPDLAEEIARKLPGLGEDVVGVNLLRKHVFMGRWVRHGGRYPLVLLRIWRRGKGRIEQRWMDEHIVVENGRTVTFEGGFADDNRNDLTFFTDKHNKYATREAIDVLNLRYRLFATDDAMTVKSTSWQASVKRIVKERLYNKLPFWLGPLGYFLYRYFLQLGFLDGREGMIYHFLQGFWYRFLVGAKVFEFDRELRGLEGAEERMQRLSNLTGYELIEDLSQRPS